jgi:hypothetical protein
MWGKSPDVGLNHPQVAIVTRGARVFGPGARRRKGADLSSLEKLETLIINSQNPIDLLTKSGPAGITIEFRALVHATLAAIEFVFYRLRDMTMQKFDYGKHIVLGPFLY